MVLCSTTKTVYHVEGGIILLVAGLSSLDFQSVGFCVVETRIRTEVCRWLGVVCDRMLSHPSYLTATVKVLIALHDRPKFIVTACL